MTILDHLLSAIQKAATYNRHDLAQPSVILWTDGERLWDGVAAAIAKVRPGLFRFDEEENKDFSGTAAWIRYQFGSWKGEETPVIYLPGIHRHQFRGAAGFPDAARHLYALQFQGQFFSQQSGKDWTPLAFLSSEDAGICLDVARDQATIQAIQQLLGAILLTPSANLQGKRIEASDLHDLAVGDSVRMLLEWMSDPAATSAGWSAEQRAAFDGIAKKEFGFDPQKDGQLIAAENLAAADGKWGSAWTRFAEAPPANFPGIVSVLAKVEPGDLFGGANIRLPLVNRRMEDDLRAALLAVRNLPASEVTARIVSLAKDHEERSRSLWVAHGEAPLARAVQHLAKMVDAMKRGLQSHSYDSLAESYMTDGWIVDAEARHAWTSARRSEDAMSISEALRATYLPWLQQMAELLQSKSSSYPMASVADAIRFELEPGTVLLFIDGFRADLAKQFIKGLNPAKVIISESVRWSALPSVTATAKPAWHPISESLVGEQPSEKFEPTLKASGKPNSTDAFRKLLSENGWTFLPPSENGNPTQSAWTEIGTLDKQGHSLGAKVAWQVEGEIEGIEQRVRELFEAGWKKVILVTDHGWLWMPGGLPKVDLPKHLTQSKWGRCALPDPQAKHSLPQVHWFWGNEHPIVMAPGAGVFIKGQEYTHGGLSLQECLTLVVTLTQRDVPASKAETSIASLKWTGLKLLVEISASTSALSVDLRMKPADATSSLLSESQRSKTVDDNGKLSVFVENDSLEGQAAVLVLLKGGDVVAKKNIIIGEN